MSTSNEIAENANGNGNRKRKLSDMLGPQWSKQELDRFYEAYSKYGKNWEKVASIVGFRSVEMVESLYSMNEGYLSLPKGGASLGGLVATMDNHYGKLTADESKALVIAEAAIDTEGASEIRSVFTSELPKLRMQLSNDNHFPAKVTLRSSINVVKRICACLSEHEKAVFRSYTQLGHFLDLPFPWEFFGQLAHFLVLRKLETTEENEVWFSLEGKPSRFSLAEFAVVSGLNTGRYPSNEEISKRTRHHRLIDQYFYGQEKITVIELGKKFEEMKSDQPGGDKIKIAFVYLLSGFLVARDPRRFIDPLYLQLVDDLSFFNKYPWGRVSYNLTLKYLKTDMKHKWEERCRFGKTTKENLHLCGCPHLFQVWAFEAIPRLGELLGARLDGARIPRFLRRKPRNVNKNTLCYMIKEAIQDPELIVYPNLTPSEEERLYYSNRGSLNDCADDLDQRSLSDDDATLHGDITPCHGDYETPTQDVGMSRVKQERMDLAAYTVADPILTPPLEERLYYTDRGSVDDCRNDLINRRLSLSDNCGTLHSTIYLSGREDKRPIRDAESSHIKQERVDPVADTNVYPSLGEPAGGTRCDGIAPSCTEDDRLPREVEGPLHEERGRTAPEVMTGVTEERGPTSEHLPERDLSRAGIVDELKSYVDSQLELARCWHEAIMRRMERQEDLARQRHNEVMRRMDYIVEHLVRRRG